jgi:spore coat assembly protein SafA
MLDGANQTGISNGVSNARYQPPANEGQTHTVERGDTLSAIAKEHGVSLAALIAANPQIKNPDLIYPGDKINIPAGGGGEQAADVGENASTARAEVNMTDQARAAQVRGAPAGSTGGNNILSNISTSGASAKTARQDGLSGGVSSSQTMANTDAARVLKYKDAFNAAGAKYGLPPALLAAIASRESRGGAALDKNGRGDGGNGYGLMQVDVGTRPNPKGGPYSAAHIDEAASILKEKLDAVKAKYPNASAADQLKLATAKYNGGSGTITNPDKGTTGGDYSNDVIARAQTYAANWGATLGSTGTTPSTPSAPPTGSVPAAGLARGSTGEGVKVLQSQLVKLGYMSAADMATGPGTFGPRTEAALKAFQTANNIAPTGKFGPTTQAAMQKGGIPASTTGDASTNTSKIPTLRQGDAASSKVRSVGCGITSATMAINGLTGKHMTPDQFYAKYGFGLNGGMEANGLKVTNMSDLHSGNMSTENKAWDVFKNATGSGKVVMFAANGQPFTKGSYGHIMLATGTSTVNGQRMVTFNDPATGTSRTVPFDKLWNAPPHREGNFVRVISK